MHPDDFRNVLAPGLLAHHQQEFHLGIVHYHFSTIGGEIVLVLLAVLVVVGGLKWLLGRS
jgi:hypothetical protein